MSFPRQPFLPALTSVSGKPGERMERRRGKAASSSWQVLQVEFRAPHHTWIEASYFDIWMEIPPSLASTCGCPRREESLETVSFPSGPRKLHLRTSPKPQRKSLGYLSFMASDWAQQCEREACVCYIPIAFFPDFIAYT